MKSESAAVAAKSATLYWPGRGRDSRNYQLARRAIAAKNGVMPTTVSNVEVPKFFKKKTNFALYYPIFTDSVGWWGELLGSNAKITDKIILSPECQLIEIQSKPAHVQQSTHFFAAEIRPTREFFSKSNIGGAVAQDMLATESGTVIALFSGKSAAKFTRAVAASGNVYLGCVGGY